MSDLHNKIHAVRAISPVSVGDNTASVSQIIDRQGYNSLEFVILTGSLADADATFTVLVEEGAAANLSDAAAVADADLLGLETQASFQYDDDNKCKKIGYRGSKRYVRLTVTPANNASAALIAAVALLGTPYKAPTPTI
jgi:hypothetical protein